MTDTTNTPVIRTADPADLLALIERQLGFTPSRSLVVVSLRENGRVGLVVRIDLADVNHVTLPEIVQHLVHDRAQALVTVVYNEDAEHAQRVAGEVAAHAETFAIDSVPAIHVTTETFRVGGQGAARPRTEIQATVVAAASVFSGKVVRGSAAQCLPQATGAADRTTARNARQQWQTRATTIEDRANEGWAAWQAALSGGTATPASWGEVAAALQVRAVRDAVLVSLVPDTAPEVAAAVLHPTALLGSPEDSAVGVAVAKIVHPSEGVRPGHEATRALEVLAQVIAHNDDSPAAWTLWGLIQWWAGNGALARLAIGTALEQDSFYRLARQIEGALIAGMPPGWVQRTPRA